MHYSSSVDAQTSSLRGARWVVGDWTRRSMHDLLAGLAVVFTFILVDVFRVTFGGRTGGLDGLFGFFLFPFHNSLFRITLLSFDANRSYAQLPTTHPNTRGADPITYRIYFYTPSSTYSPFLSFGKTNDHYIYSSILHPYPDSNYLLSFILLPSTLIIRNPLL